MKEEEDEKKKRKKKRKARTHIHINAQLHQCLFFVFSHVDERLLVRFCRCQSLFVILPDEIRSIDNENIDDISFSIMSTKEAD
jgi:hypothetical protein